MIKSTGLSERAINLALNKLDQLGLIHRDKHGGPGGNRYGIGADGPAQTAQAKPKKKARRPQSANVRTTKPGKAEKLQVGSADLFDDEWLRAQADRQKK